VCVRVCVVRLMCVYVCVCVVCSCALALTGGIGTGIAIMERRKNINFLHRYLLLTHTIFCLDVQGYRVRDEGTERPLDPTKLSKGKFLAMNANNSNAHLPMPTDIDC
jgi:hypothetical protein